MKKSTICISRVRNLSRDRDLDEPVVRVFNAVLEPLGGRGTWVAIRGNGMTIFRRALGSGATPDMTAETIELDYDARNGLGIDERAEDGGYVCDLSLQRASLGGRFYAHWRHPHNEYRAPFQIAMIGLVLGVIGLFLGIAGLLK